MFMTNFQIKHGISTNLTFLCNCTAMINKLGVKVMTIKKEEFFEIIREVSKRKDLSSDNVLKKVQDKLKEKSDENGIDSPYTTVYNIFKSNSFYKNHEFKLQMQDNTTARGTLLHFAVQCSNALMVKFLLQNKVSATMKDHSGLTPLDIATSDSNQEIKQLLLDAKANPKLEKNKDKIPRDIITKANKTPEDLVVNRNNAAAALENGNKQTSIPLNKSSSDDSGICTKSKDREDIDAKNEELKKLEKELAESKSHVTEYQTKLEALKKLNEENQPLKQQIQDLGNENTKLKGELEKTKTKEVLLEKKQKELKNDIAGQEARLEALEQEIQELGNENTTLKGELEKIKNQHSNDLTEHETKLEEFNKENKSLKQKIKSQENENTPLKSELGKTKTNEVSLEKTGKRQVSPKVAYASLAAMLVVGAALSIASGLSALLIVAASVVSALIAGGIACTISKPIAEPDTELKEVKVQHNGVCKT